LQKEIRHWVHPSLNERRKSTKIRTGQNGDNEKSELYMWWNSRSSEKGKKEKEKEIKVQQQQHRSWKFFVGDNRDNLLVKWNL
jgi:hypothetical protein